MSDNQLKALKQEPGEEDTKVVGAAVSRVNNAGDDKRPSLTRLLQKAEHQSQMLAQQKAELDALRTEHATMQQLLLERDQRLALQSKKINALLLESERLGAERELLRSLERRLLHISSNPHAALAQLLAYQRFVHGSLGSDLHQAETHLNQLLHYSREMSAPAHRAVRFFARKARHTRLGRLVSNIMHGLYAMRSARQQS